MQYSFPCLAYFTWHNALHSVFSHKSVFLLVTARCESLSFLSAADGGLKNNSLHQHIPKSASQNTECVCLFVEGLQKISVAK